MDASLHSLPQPDPRDKKKYYFTDTHQRRALIVLARTMIAPVLTWEATGVDNLPRQGEVILAANHVTNFDVFPIQFSLPRPVFFMGKAELFKNPILDVLIRNLSGFPVQRGEKDPWAMDHALKILRHGQVLGMFPEGRRSQGRGLGVAKTGTARLAIEARCPIVPITVVGSDQLFRRFPRRTRVQITLLPPLTPERDENPLALTDRLMFTLARALPPEMRGVYAAMPTGFGG